MEVSDAKRCHTRTYSREGDRFVRFHAAYRLSRARCSFRNLATLGAITTWQ
jgi:hypothetical protein